jgi:hypothetical protein
VPDGELEQSWLYATWVRVSLNLVCGVNPIGADVVAVGVAKLRAKML